jgi:formate hydrogenlyase subunit 3/multisubunit Na+/H+ antiporter MnhD subunit
MGTQASLLPLTAVILPVVTSILIALLRRNAPLRDATLIIGAGATFIAVFSMLPGVVDGTVYVTELGEFLPGVPASFTADGMGMVFAALASLLWVLAAFYAIGYMRGDHAKNQTRFYAFYSLCLSTAFATAFAGDLITFFIAYELLTVTTYPLVTHKGDDKAITAGRTYLGYLLAGGALVLFAIIIVYASTGTLTFQAGGIIGDNMSTGLMTVVFLLFAVGFGTKAGLIPLHAWLPGAMVAPTPVSALLHAVAVVKAGVFAIGRTMGFVFGPDVLADLHLTTVLASVAAMTIVVASILALRQDHLKRRLAYSTIAHLSYIVLGFALVARGTYEGALMHMWNHGALKITLFFAAGAIHIAAHKDYVSELDGIGRKMPFTMGAFTIAAIGLAGFPPIGGFLSKWHLVLGAFQNGDVFFALVMTFSGVFTAAYLFPIVYRAFAKPSPDGPGRKEASWLMVGPLTATAGLAVLLGLGDPVGLYQMMSDVAVSIVAGGR